MKRIVLFLCMFSAAGALKLSASPSGRMNAGDAGATIEEKLLQMEREWAVAMMKNDAAAIERIEAEDYAYIMDGFPGDRKGDVADAKSGAFSGSAYLTEMKARVYGAAAVVTGKASLRDAKYKGKDISGNYLFTDTFVERNGRWQVVASHSNKVRTR
jgi:ketosteroid isomerase-like protein